jgi:hypothetical protein
MTESNGTTATKRLRSIELINDGVAEVIEIGDDDESRELMASLGWIRREQSLDMATALIKAGQERVEPATISFGSAAQAEVAMNGNGANGHPIPDLETVSRRTTHCDCAEPKFEQRGFVQWCAACDRVKFWSPDMMSGVSNLDGSTVGPASPLTPVEWLGGAAKGKEAADRVPLPELVNEYRAQNFITGNARNSGDIALEVVSSLIHVLEAERKARA